MWGPALLGVVAVVGERWYAGGEEEDEVREEGRGRVVVEEDVVAPRYPVIDEHATIAMRKKRSWRSSPPVGRVVAKVVAKVEGTRVARVAVGTREPEETNGRNTTTTQGTTTTRVITRRRGIIMTTVMGTATTSIPIRIIIPRVDEEEVGVVVASDGDVGEEVADEVVVVDEVLVTPVHRKTAAMLPPTSSHRTVQTRLRVRRRLRRATIPHR